MLDHSKRRGVLVRLPVAFILIFGTGLGSSLASSGQKKGEAESVSALASFEDTRGRLEPLRLPLAVNEDARWPSLVFSEYFGPKSRVSIGGIEVGGESGGEESCGPLSARPIEAWLAASIVRSKRFEIVGTTAPVTGFSDRESPGTGYVIHGAIVGCTLRLETADDGIEAARVEQLISEVSMSFRATSAGTGQVLFSTVEHSRISHRQEIRSDGPPNHISLEDLLAAVHSAIRANLNKAVYRLVEWSGKRPWSGKVVAVEDGRVTIDAGTRQGLTTAMILQALVSGRDLIDPESGLILGSISERAGRLQIVEVKENLAIATILEGCEGIRRGDRVELQDLPAAPIDRPPSARTGQARRRSSPDQGGRFPVARRSS